MKFLRDSDHERNESPQKELPLDKNEMRGI